MQLSTVCVSESSVVMTDVSLHQLFAKVREDDDFAAVLRTVMEDVASKVDFSHVKSCVAMLHTTANARSTSRDAFCRT